MSADQVAPGPVEGQDDDDLTELEYAIERYALSDGELRRLIGEVRRLRAEAARVRAEAVAEGDRKIQALRNQMAEQNAAHAANARRIEAARLSEWRKAADLIAELRGEVREAATKERAQIEALIRADGGDAYSANSGYCRDDWGNDSEVIHRWHRDYFADLVAAGSIHPPTDGAAGAKPRFVYCGNGLHSTEPGMECPWCPSVAVAAGSVPAATPPTCSECGKRCSADPDTDEGMSGLCLRCLNGPVPAPPTSDRRLATELLARPMTDQVSILRDLGVWEDTTGASHAERVAAALRRIPEANRREVLARALDGTEADRGRG